MGSRAPGAKRPVGKRLIIATCDKGAVEDLDDMKDIKADIDKIKAANPNFVDIAAHDVFRHRDVNLVADASRSRRCSPIEWLRAC